MRRWLSGLLLGLCIWSGWGTALFAADPAVSILIQAIRERKVDQVHTMLIANPQLAHGVDPLGASVLHYAAECGDKRIIQSVLAHRPNTNFPDRAGKTPIFRACEKTLLDNMRLLLTYQAQPNVADTNGMTPLLIVCEKGKPQMAQALLAAGANIAAVDKRGTTPLMYAALRGNKDLVTILLGAGAQTNAVDIDGNTPLHLAARNDHRAMIPLFPSLINVKNKAGQTPMTVAALSGHTKFVQEMAKIGATN